MTIKFMQINFLNRTENKALKTPKIEKNLYQKYCSFSTLSLLLFLS